MREDYKKVLMLSSANPQASFLLNSYMDSLTEREEKTWDDLTQD